MGSKYTLTPPTYFQGQEPLIDRIYAPGKGHLQRVFKYEIMSQVAVVHYYHCYNHYDYCYC